VEDTKGAIKIRISKNRKHKGEKKKYKRKNNVLQNIIYSQRSSNTSPTKDRGELDLEAFRIRTIIYFNSTRINFHRKGSHKYTGKDKIMYLKESKFEH
jgi:hypothetical protein